MARQALGKFDEALANFQKLRQQFPNHWSQAEGNTALTDRISDCLRKKKP